MVRIGVVLSGCGYLDGSEIHEAVLTLLHLDRAGAEAVCFAPDQDQRDVVDHRNGEPVAGARRNVLVEAARIARGRIRDLAEAKAEDLDGLILPGGYGAAKNLSSFAVEGPDGSPHPRLAELVRDLHAARKPIGAICISPAVVAMIFRGTGVAPKLTIGEDRGTAAAIEKMGGRHVTCSVRSFVKDEENRIVATPAYMCDARISEVEEGVRGLVQQVLSWAGAPVGS